MNYTLRNLDKDYDMVINYELSIPVVGHNAMDLLLEQEINKMCETYLGETSHKNGRVRRRLESD